MFYKQIILNKGIPFEIKKPKDIEEMTDKENNNEIMKGYKDVIKGKVKLANKVFEEEI